MVLYLGNRHTATVTVKEVLPFTCQLCGHQANALVVGVGQGQGNSAYFLDEKGAESRASSSGEVSAAPGPERAQRHAPQDAARLRRRRRLPLAARHICGPLAVFTGGFIYWSQKWKWETAENRVAFISEK